MKNELMHVRKILHIATIFLYAFWMPLKNVYYIIYLDFSLFCAIHIWELANNLYEWMFFKCLLTSPFYPKSLLAVYKLVACKRWKGVIYDSRPALHFSNISIFTWELWWIKISEANIHTYWFKVINNISLIMSDRSNCILIFWKYIETVWKPLLYP